MYGVSLRPPKVFHHLLYENRVNIKSSTQCIHNYIAHHVNFMRYFFKIHTRKFVYHSLVLHLITTDILVRAEVVH